MSEKRKFPALWAALDYATEHKDSKPYEWVAEAREAMALIASLEQENKFLRDSVAVLDMAARIGTPNYQRTGNSILDRIRSFTSPAELITSVAAILTSAAKELERMDQEDSV
jgi:hypothetical protein